MRRTMYWRVAVCAAAVFGGSSISLPVGLGFVGVGPAEAKSYYTRKRVNGRWITGRFPKKGFSKSNAASTGRAAKRRSGASVEVNSGAAPRHTSLAPPDIEPTVTKVPSGVAQPIPLPLPQAAPVMVPVAATVEAAPPSEDERLNKLREALRARANSLTTGTLSPAPAVRTAPEPQSVSLDFTTGTKTTIFSDGTSIQEPFDVGAMRGLAAPAPIKGAK